MQLDFRSISDLDGFKRVIELQRAAWGMSDLEITPQTVLHAAVKTGGQVIGAFTPDNQLAAFLLAFLGHDSQRGRPFLLSQLLAVSPSLQSQSVGYDIKLAQKRDALARGISLIKWTYDPLFSKNANINLRKLGARVYTFYPNLYGELDFKLYGRLPTDRFEVSWDLNNQHSNEFPEVAPQLINLQSGVPRVATPLLADSAEALLCRLPLDHAALRECDPDKARQWQIAFREVGTALLNGTHVVCGFRISSESGLGEYLFRTRASLERVSI